MHLISSKDVLILAVALSWTAGGLFEIIKSILPVIKQRLVSVCWYLRSLSPDGACLWELSHSDLIAVSCLKGDPGIKPAPSSLSLSSLHSQSTSLLFLKTIHLPFENLFCQELLAAGPRGRAPQVIINLVCFVFLGLCAGVGLKARRTLASAHIISDVSKRWLLLGLAKEGHFWGLECHLVND